MHSRRNFIKNGMFLSGGLMMTSPDFFSFNLTSQQTRVVVIGAGLSGLAAAYQLRKRGIDVVVLEARNRLGGRVYTHTIDAVQKLNIEMGGEWISKAQKRMLSLCNEFGLPMQDNHLQAHLYYNNKYSKPGAWSMSDNWQRKISKLKMDFVDLRPEEQTEMDKLDWWRYLLNNGCDGADLDLQNLLDSIDFGESIRQVSAYAALNHFTTVAERKELPLKIAGGNGRLAEALADRIGRERIKTGYPVQKIEQGAKVKVTCNNGQVFEADKLICTIPTQAIKKIQWLPGLPFDKVEAINELQYSRVHKSAILYTKRFWNDESFDIVTDSTPHFIYHGTKLQKSPKGVLIAYAVGDKAEVMARQNENGRATLMQQALQPVFGSTRAMMEKQFNYYWGDDEYAKGAYSIYRPGQWFRLRPVLQKPFMNTYFAGEHIADLQASMEGAVISGEKAAAMI